MYPDEKKLEKKEKKKEHGKKNITKKCHVERRRMAVV